MSRRWKTALVIAATVGVYQVAASAGAPVNGSSAPAMPSGPSAAPKSLVNYEKALKINPGFADAIEYRGEAYLGLNRIEDAKQAYLTLFAKDRAQADSLMKAMNTWVSKHQAEPAGVDPAVVTGLDS